MNKKFLFFIATALFLSAGVNAQNAKAAAYNNKIIKIQHNLTPKLVAFFQSWEKGDLKDLKKQQDALVKLFDRDLKKISAMKGFEGDEGLRDAALEWFLLYKKSLDKEYDHILELVANKDRSKEDHAKMDKLTDELVKQEEEVDAKFEQAQIAFAQKHKLEIKEAPIKNSQK